MSAVSSLNPLAREVNVKVVYYGPGLSGKTTSLKHVYSVLKPESRGELVSLATETDRTLFFDFLPIHLERVNDLSVRLQVYTVPGQIFYEATRKLVLNGADGVVFVADSQRAAAEANAASMKDLRDNLSELGVDLDRFPLVLQYNKRDVANAMPVPQLRAALNARQAPEFETVAQSGHGVYPAFKDVVRRVLVDLKSKQSPRRRPREAAPAAPEAAPEITLTDLRVPTEIHERGPVPGISLAPLVPAAGDGVREVERLVFGKQYGPAVRAAAAQLAALLRDLPSTDPTPAAKAALLGLHGLHYLRLCRLAGQPDQAIQEVDALFALHFLVGAALEAQRI